MFAMTDGATVLIALGSAVVVSILAPLVVGWVSNRGKRTDAAIRKDERAEDNARLDKQAAEAKAAATALLASNLKIAELTEGNTVEIAAIKTNGEKAVHLADGAYTAAKKTERWALSAKLASDRMLMAYKHGTGEPPGAGEYAAIEQGEAMVKALDGEIAAREAAVALAAAEAAAAADKTFTPPHGTPTTQPAPP